METSNETTTTTILEEKPENSVKEGSMKYDGNSIVVMDGMEAVRARPGMYIGDTGKRGLHHLVWEILDNSVDEALGGFANAIFVRLWKNGDQPWISVMDNGRGIPIDIHPQTGRPSCETIMTVLHAGGKFKGEAYKFSGGLHGVGASVVNALSESLVMDIVRDNASWTMRFSRGIVVEELARSRRRDFVQGKSGTRISFTPDYTVFLDVEDHSFDIKLIEKRLRELSYLIPNVNFELTDETGDTPVIQSFKSDNGIEGLLLAVTGRLERLTPPISVMGERDGVPVMCSFAYVQDYTERMFSYVNLIPTHDGGTHVVGFKTGLTKAVNECARFDKLMKEKEDNITGEDLREGLTAVVSVNVREPQFEGQTKGRLGNMSVSGPISSIVYEKLSYFFGTTEGKPVLARIVEKALETRRAREAAKHARELVRKSSKNELKFAMPGKLADCSSDNPEERELFIVEGDSAGGSAKQGRDRKTQAILPLRGKILNCEKAKMGAILGNEEIRTMITTLGCGIGDELDLSALRYGKVVIMTDADVDGAHIRTLLLTFFYRLMPGLLESGRICSAMPPLYRVTTGKEERYIHTDKEMSEYTKKLGNKKYTLQRYKGLGEMSAEQLWETTMNPATRIIRKLRIEDAVEADEVVTSLMGASSDTRKLLLLTDID